jgi:osmoprotectant transport system permease protein
MTPPTAPSLLAFFLANLHELGTKLLEQVYLVGLSISIAIVLGVALGVLISRQRVLQAPILGITSLLQTIPSLALLGFLLPFLGIGIKPALVALSIYALLPIVRNTVVGLQNVPSELIEAARELGSSRWQRLFWLELPLAFPVMIAGIRTAVSMSVGIATLAAFIGAGGLGDFINQGLALNNTNLILLGAIPAALLALGLDLFIGYCQKQFKQGNRVKKKILLLLMVALFSIIPIIKGWSLISPLLMSEKNSIVRIATKNFAEQLILGEILAQLIEAKTNLTVERKFNLGSTAICHQALLNGEIDLYPEYTGTAYLLVLKEPYTGKSPDEIYALVKLAYQTQFNLVWLSPFGFNNTQALAVSETFAKKYRLKSISDLKNKNLELKLRLGVPSEFMRRPDGMEGLKKTYQLNFSTIQELDAGLLYQAIAENHVDIIAAFSTDGRIPTNHLQLLKDDKFLFPPYYAAPVIRNAVLQAHPELRDVLRGLADLIDDATMQRLNSEVDLKKRPPADIAREFLIEKKLL